jgi:hypothetical protein
MILTKKPKTKSLMQPKKVVIIQAKLKDELSKQIDSYNRENKPKLKLDVAVYFLSLFNSLPTNNREDNEKQTISLSSQRLKKLHSSYNQYINFFIDHDFIYLIKNYSSDSKSCKKYTLNVKYKFDKVLIFEIKDITFLKRFNNKGNDETTSKKWENCNILRPHLIECFNNKLSIKAREAYDKIKYLFYQSDTYSKAINSIQLITEFHYKQWKYSINEETDNRLHSNLTRSPKDLRKFIRYDDKPIAGVDVKTSQPYFFMALITSIVNQNRDLLNNIGAKKILKADVIKKLFDINLDKVELRKFYCSVIKKDFYSEFEKIITIEVNDNGKPIRKVQKKENPYQKNSNKTKIYNTKRDLVKEVVMEIFNSKPKTTIREAAQFRKEYPSIQKIFVCLHENGIKLHQLLQQIESYVLLDCVAKEIHDKNPDMPMFSIHDCLVTTIDQVEALKSEMEKEIEKVTTIKVKTEIEFWN